MSYKSNLDKKNKLFLKKMKSRRREKTQTQVLSTDLEFDLNKLSDELLKKVCRTAVGYAGTIVRQQAKENVRSGGGETLGMSRKTKTRGVFKGGRMVNVGKGAWSNKPLSERGANNKSLGDTGGIVKSRVKFKDGLAYQVVGPRYEAGPRGKNFAHTHEPVGSASTGAPNHKWWGMAAKRKLKARPWLGPAGRSTLSQQKSAVKKALINWKIDPSEVAK